MDSIWGGDVCRKFRKRQIAWPLTLPLATLLVAPAALMAQDRPASDAMPLSQVLAALEHDLGVELAYIDDVKWDDDGAYEVEYHMADGREVKLRLDPLTGESR